MKLALDFSREKGYRHIFLYTVSILETARHLYASYGFTLTETKENKEWGQDLVEERWDLHF